MRQIYGNSGLQGMTLVLVACAELVGILVESSLLLPSFALIIGAAIALIGVVLLWQENRLLALITLFIILGAWRYNSASLVEDPLAISRSIGATVIVRGTVSEEPKQQDTLLSIAVNDIRSSEAAAWQDAHGQLTIRVRSIVENSPYSAQYGSSVEIRGKLLSPFPGSPPGIAASMFFPRVTIRGMEGNPIIGALYQLRATLSNIIEQSLPQPMAALLIALLLSAHTAALKPLLPVFNETGTAHLIAPSGFKVTILAGIIASNTTWLYREKGVREKLLPAQRRGGWRRWLSTLLVVIAIIVYTLLSGAGPAAVRAGIMGVLLIVAPRIGRRYNIYTALAAAALLMSVVDPFVLWDAGFQLSFLGTLGIVLLTPFFQHVLRPLERIPFSHYLIEPFAVTLAAETATEPILVLNFHVLSVFAPLTNMLTVPLLGPLITLGALICIAGLLWLPLAQLIGWVAQPLLRYLIYVVTWNANLAGSYINIGTLDIVVACGYYALLVPLLWLALRRWSTPDQQKPSHPPQPERRSKWRAIQLGIAALFIVATALLSLLPQSRAGITITFLHVGPAGAQAQGEAILIRTPDDKTILIDGGLDATSLSQELDSRLPPWQRSLDAVLLTTSRPDHLKGLLDIVKRYSINKVIDSGMLHPNTTYALWRRTISERNFSYLAASQGTGIDIGAFVSLQVLWPVRPLHKGSDEARDNGLIVRVVTPGMRLLLLGASAQSRYALAGLLNNSTASYLRADVVQIVEGAEANAELNTVLQRSRSGVLIVTPASSKRRIGAQLAQPSSPLKNDAGTLQIVQTAQAGTVELTSYQSGWNITIDG